MLLALLEPRTAAAQTPSPLQEWQYSSGVILARLFEPKLPQWRVVAGLAAEAQPVYSGARAMRVQGGPAFDVRYRDVAFLSTGDGLGFNILHGAHYQLGVAMGYDLGRRERDDLRNLHGMGDIGMAPVAKAYGAWVISRYFPMILRVDARQFLGGTGGAAGDASVYLPLPGSSHRFVMFAGPSITVGTHQRLRGLYGVTPQQSLQSGHPVYDPHRGTSAAGVGFTAVGFLTSHWLVNVDAALSHLRGSSSRSPLVERRTERALVLTLAWPHE